MTVLSGGSTVGGTRPTWVAYGYGLLVAAILGHFLLGLPIQVSDSFGEIIKLAGPWSEVVGPEFTETAYLRPMMSAELKLVYDLSGGDYFAWFRGTHVVQVVVLVLLYLALVRPRTWLDAGILPLGLAVLFGLHTFFGTVREAFPINTYMTVLLFCFAAAVLALAEYRWWNDVLVVVLFAIAALTVESGLLVWAIAVGAAMLGARGISRAGVGALVVLLAGYFFLRFGLLDVGVPSLLERSSGFGFSVLEPDDLIERFGSNPIPFYAYNVVASALSVLLSEPSGGVFGITRAVMTSSVQPAMIVNLVSSAAVCLLLALCAWTRRRQWGSWTLDRDDRLVLLFGMVLAANAVISYPYTKDVIMSPAGAFLAVAVFAAARQVIGRVAQVGSAGAAAALVVAAVIVSAAWAVRVEALHAGLRQASVTERLDWAYVESDIARGAVLVPDAHAESMLRLLRNDALAVHPAPPPLDLPLGRMLAGDD
jgi:hypothetical protein